MPLGSAQLVTAVFTSAAVALATLAVPGSAQGELPALPFADSAPRIHEGLLLASAVGAPGARANPSAAHKAAADQAAARALEMMRAFVDQNMARRRVRPRVAAQVHLALAALVRRMGSRPLVDGSVIVRVGFELSDFLTRTGLSLRAEAEQVETP